MKKIPLAALPAVLIALVLPHYAPLRAQAVNASQQIVLQGLRTSANHGSLLAAAYGPDGSLYLLLDQHDGLRLLKTDPSGSTVLAQAQEGSTGDSGVAMALDPSGNVYVTGTTTSRTLSATAGAPFSAPADTTTNSFLAKFDASLNRVFLTFLGAGRTASTGVAATTDAVFVTGITYSATFPVTAAGIQQAPASGSSENGFVERFSTSGTLLTYATYLTGLNGNTAPTAIAADSSDNAYITGSTTSSGFPAIAAIEPSILGTTSGFLTKLAPAGNAFVLSTFIAGSGLTGMALDAANSSLLLTGNVSPGQFPIATVAAPLASTSDQSLLRIPLDGQTVADSVLLVPGTQSFVTPGPNKTAWISGSLTTPLFPGETPPDYDAGDSFLLHLTATDTIDQTLRFGGLAANNANYASLTSNVAAPAVSGNGSTVALPGSITATVSSSLLSTQRFDLPMAASPDAALPNTLRDVVPTAAACGNASQCSGSGALLAIVATASSAPSLSLSTDNLPNVTMRNLGSTTVNGIALVATGFTVTSNCGLTLAPSSQCSVALTGAGPGSLTVSAAGAPGYTMSLPANTLPPDPLALSTDEVDFGITTSTSPATRAVMVTNLSATSQTFTPAKDGGPATTPYTITVTSKDCVATSIANTFTLAAGSACHLNFTLAASTSSANDGAIRSVWKVGTRNVVLTGFAQAASLNLSAAEVDFGTQFTGASAIRLPRYLYLSNNSSAAIAHVAAALPTSIPFTVTDRCPSSLEPHSVCQLTLSYASVIAPSHDAATLALDQGLSVLLTGSTLEPATVTGTSSNPSLSVSTPSVTFPTPVVVTGVSTSTQTVTVTNNGSTAFTLVTAMSGDFTTTSGCTSTLAAGASCQLLVSFAPSQPGTRQGVLSATAGTGFAPALVALNGTGLAILPANNGTLNLGQTLAGEPVVVWYQVQQSLTSLTVTTASPQFGVVLVANNGAPPTSLAPSAFTQATSGACNACYLGVQFLGQTAGNTSTTLTLSTVSWGNPYQLTLLATALPVQGLLLTPITQDFGPVAINSSSAPIAFTLANLLTPAASTNIQSVTTTGDFNIATNTTGGATCTGALTPTASCFIPVAFVPSATGPRSGTLTVVTSSGTATSTLSGYGLPDPGIAINPESLSFQSVPGNAATQQIITLSNTGTVNQAIEPAVASDPSFSVASTCASLIPGALCNLTVTFTPQSSPITATLTIPVTSTLNGQTATATYTVSLSGVTTTQTAGLELLPAIVNYGSTATGSPGVTRQFTLNNLSAKALNITLTMPRQFALTSNADCPTLTAGASCTFSASFLPVTAGTITGTIFAQGAPTDGSATLQQLNYLLGYGSSTSPLSIAGNPVPSAPLNFGQATSGQSLQKTLTLTNSGLTTLTIRRITSEPPFLPTSTCGSALPPSASCSVTLTYAPVYEVASGSSSGPRNDAGSLIIESDAASSPDIVDLSGMAAAIISSSPSNIAVIAALEPSQGSLSFPSTAVGSASTAATLTLTNGGTTTLHISGVIAPQDFSATSTCATLLPGATCTIAIQFTPGNGSTATVRSGAIEIQSDAGNALEFVSVVGTSSAASLSLIPASLSFGSVRVSSSASLPIMVTNAGTTPVTLQSFTASGDYSVSQGTCPAAGSALAAGISCALSVAFTPTTSGTRTGALILASDATALPITATLTGTGVVPQLVAAPSSLPFGSIALGSATSLTLTLTNNGSSTLTGITASISGTNSSDFTISTPCSTTFLTANSSCTLTVAFTPAATGVRTAELTLTSSDPAGPVVVSLTGTGTPPPSFALTVNGTSSATATVTSGTPATYNLLLTPSNGFSGTVALTCTPVTPAQYASCSLLASTLTLGSSAQSSTATINTVTSSSSGVIALLLGIMAAPLAAMVIKRRERRSKGETAAILTVGLLLCLGVTSCGGHPQSGNNSRLLYTPAGTYQYQVTATSTSGPQITSTVTLNLIVQ